MYLGHIKHSQNSTVKKETIVRKWAKEMNRYFTREEVNKHMGRCSTSLAIREISLWDITMSYQTGKNKKI